MKKILAFIFINICLLSCLNFQNIVYASTSIFAKVENINVCFYSSPIDTASNQLFEIPQSYFVELLANAEDDDDLFYSARYLDMCGYVKKSDVLPVQGSPIKPFASDINFRVFAPNGLDLKSTPNGSLPFNKVITVPYLCSNLIFYGKISGEQMIPQKSNLWYYCKYLNGEDSYYGYLYSDLCDSLTPITQNTETLPAFEGDLFYTPPEVQEQNILSSKPSTLKIVIIVAICLPFLFVVYLIFKPTKLAENTEKSPAKKPRLKRLKRAEYYEIDD